MNAIENGTVTNAQYGTSSPERVNIRNGYRHPDFDTRAGTLDIAIPKGVAERSGEPFPPSAATASVTVST